MGSAQNLAIKAAYVLAIALMVAALVGIWQNALFEGAVPSVRPGNDFMRFHGTALLVVEGNGAAMYEPAVLGARIAEATGYTEVVTQPYGHPPFFSLFFLPLTQLPFVYAYLVFLVAGGLALALAISRVGLNRVGVAIGLALLSVPGFWTVQLGQMGLWVSALMLAIFLSLRAGHRFNAGLLLGLLAFKPLYAVGIGMWWLLGARRYAPAIAGAACSAATLVVVGFAVPSGWTGYRALFDESGGSFFADVATSGFSILEMWSSMMPGSSLAVLLWLGSTVGVVVAFRQALRHFDHKLESSFALAVVVGLLIAPRTGWYDWVLLIVPGVLLWHAYPGLRGQAVVAGAWLFPTAALSWLLAWRIEGVTGTFVQLAPIVLAAVAWWWSKQVIHPPSDVLEGALPS